MLTEEGIDWVQVEALMFGVSREPRSLELSQGLKEDSKVSPLLSKRAMNKTGHERMVAAKNILNLMLYKGLRLPYSF